jgi:mono/diheme cytochrome c family protein
MRLRLLVIAFVSVLVTSCGDKAQKTENAPKVEVQVVEVVDADPMLNKGIGPVKSISLGEIDEKLAEEGKVEFKAKCSACHKISKRFVGPALVGVTERRSPEWIMNMILNPEVMVAEDPIAKQLLAEYSAPMANQNLTEQEARAILEYFRTKTGASSEEE